MICKRTMNLSIISNTCLAAAVARLTYRQYDHPFFGSLFVNDHQYLKFIQKFDQYIKVEPRFGKPDPHSVWARQSGNMWYQEKTISPGYPVTYLDLQGEEPIEIHWIHEDDEKTLLETYKRRRERIFEKKLFVWSTSEFINNHTEEERKKIIDEFNKIPNSLLITNNPDENGIFVPEWEGKTNRNYYHTYDFNDQSLLAEILINYINMNLSDPSKPAEILINYTKRS